MRKQRGSLDFMDHRVVGMHGSVCRAHCHPWECTFMALDTGRLSRWAPLCNVSLQGWPLHSGFKIFKLVLFLSSVQKYLDKD